MNGRKHNARIRGLSFFLFFFFFFFLIISLFFHSERDEAMEGNPKKRHRGEDEQDESGEGTADEVEPFFLREDSDQDEDGDLEDGEEPDDDDDGDYDDDDEDDEEDDDE